MEKGFSTDSGSQWPPSGAAKWIRPGSRERLDGGKKARAQFKVVTEIAPGDLLSFVVEGNNYVATQGFLVSQLVNI